MNARPPVHRTGSSLRHALTVWAWLCEQPEPVTATAVAMLTGVSDRQRAAHADALVGDWVCDQRQRRRTRAVGCAGRYAMTARARILVLLATHRTMTTVEIFATLGIDPGTTRRHLRTLARENRVSRTSATYGNVWSYTGRAK